MCLHRRSSKVKKGALSESFFALMRCSTCKSMFPWENLTLRVDKRSLCRNYIFPDECKHRSECARSKERCLCAVTFFLVRCPSATFPLLPTVRGNANSKIFSSSSGNAPREYKRDVTVFARLRKLKYKRKFAPFSCAMRIMSIVAFSYIVNYIL